MSISVPVATSQVFADGVEVKAYLKNQVADTRRAPIGASLASGTTASGSVTLSLEPLTNYYVGAEVSSKWVYVQVTTPSSNATGMAIVASAATITLPNVGGLFEVTGTTEVKKITIQKAGTIIRLKLKETVKIVKGENLKMSATFEGTAEDIVEFVSDGTNWLECSTSANA